ncbi:MAG TPA: glycosyltransferase family 2 protein, partial [Dongiaceae bacterium]|nr:glycosyltransferase family 2 protein [Dongiaceae bacterium]
IGMYRDRKVVVVMPAYNAAKTLKRTYDEVMAQGIEDELIVVDDASTDETVQIAASLPRTVVRVHERNRGYGGNQKTCYKAALDAGADVVVMVHPDYQYTPRLLPSMVALVGGDVYPCVLGSRILGGGALKGGMPIYKYFANRGLTLVENWLLGSKLSEFHTGYRAFHADLLRELPLEANSDDFVFDNQILAQAIRFGFRIGEISCPTRYQPESSSIGFARSVRYGFGVLDTAVRYRLHRWGLSRDRLFDPNGRTLARAMTAEPHAVGEGHNLDAIIVRAATEHPAGPAPRP